MEKYCTGSVGIGRSGNDGIPYVVHLGCYDEYGKLRPVCKTRVTIYNELIPRPLESVTCLNCLRTMPERRSGTKVFQPAPPKTAHE